MRLPSAPAPMLGPTGRWAAVVEDTELALIETATGARRNIMLPAHGGEVAFAPDDARFAVQAGGRAAVLRTAATDAADAATWPQASVALEGSLFRWVLGRTRLVAVLRSGAREARLCAWRVEDDDTLTPLGAAEGLALGALAVYHMALDEAHGRVLLGGVTGRGAYSGDGKPFTGIIGLTPKLPVLWKGEGLPFQPHGYLYPLQGGALAITQRDRLARVDLGDFAAVQVVDDRSWDSPLERVALSPDGRTLAWMWAGDGDAMHVRVTALAGSTSTTDAAFTLDGTFPALAVDNGGAATVVAGARPDQLRIVTIPLPGGTVQTRSVTVPAEPDA